MSKMKDVLCELENLIEQVSGEAMRACSSITKKELSSIGEEGYLLTFTPDDETLSEVKLVMMLTALDFVLIYITTDSRTVSSNLHPHDEIPTDDIVFQVCQNLY